MLGTMLMIAVTDNMRIGGDLVVAGALLAVLGGVPFAVMWVAITALLDPAWGSEAWSGGKKN